MDIKLQNLLLRLFLRVLSTNFNIFVETFKYIFLAKLFSLLFFISFHLSFGQHNYPKNDFRSPVDFPIILAGTFGELRSNHFHAGIDIKTKGVTGKDIYAVKEGYVSRIKISHWGYGKALYITHPNGYTSVYGHLKKFSNKIEKYVKQKQYAKESFEIHLFPNKDELKISENEIVALSGNSGSSSAPHLHFEIRDSKTEKTINPLLFGFTVPDHITPKFNGLRIVPLSKNAAINHISAAQNIQTKKINNHLFIAHKTKAIGKIGIEINTHDLLNNANNKNGVYSIDMKVNDTLVYHHDLKTFAFHESKYINLLIDYEYYSKYYKKYQKTYIEPSNKLSIYKTDKNKGFLFIEDQKNYDVEIIIKDFSENTTRVKIPIKGSKIISPIIKNDLKTKYYIDQNKYTSFKQENSEVRFPKNTFYKDVYIDFSVHKDYIKVHKQKLPLNKAYTLTYYTDSLTSKQKKHIYFAYKSGKNYNYINTLKKENKIYTNTKYLGDFYIKYDSIAPLIYNPSFYDKQNISKHKTLSIYIKDKQTAIKNYYATIDDQWVLMEYQPKKNKLVFDLNDLKVNHQQHIFKLKVQDVLGNTKTYKANFYK